MVTYIYLMPYTFFFRKIMKTRCECLEIIKVLVNKCMHEYRVKFHREKNNNHLCFRFHEEEKIRVQVGNLRFEFSIFFSTLLKSNLFK
jgi:hypothetical protein